MPLTEFTVRLYMMIDSVDVPPCAIDDGAKPLVTAIESTVVTPALPMVSGLVTAPPPGRPR